MLSIIFLLVNVKLLIKWPHISRTRKLVKQFCWSRRRILCGLLNHFWTMYHHLWPLKVTDYNALMHRIHVLYVFPFMSINVYYLFISPYLFQCLHKGRMQRRYNMSTVRHPPPPSPFLYTLDHLRLSHLHISQCLHKGRLQRRNIMSTMHSLSSHPPPPPPFLHFWSLSLIH